MIMASSNILLEGFCALESGDLNKIKLLFDKIHTEVFTGGYLFLKNGEQKKGLSRYFEADWCISKSLEKDYIPLR